MTSKVSQFTIDSTYLVLGENGDSTPIPVSDRFFADLENKFGDFKGKRLVSHFTFTEDWDTWEMHPAGEEFVCLLWGQVDWEQREKVRSGFGSQLRPYILNKTCFFSCDRILKPAIYVPGFSTSQNRVAPRSI